MREHRLKQRQLSLIRINSDYNIQLLEELSRQSIIPFDNIFDFVGIDKEVEKIEFEPPLGPEGLALWVLGMIQQRLEYHHGSENIIAVMPHPIMGDSLGWSRGRVAFLSTYSNYLNVNDEKSFLRYGRKVVAHELCHLFDLEHHENKTYVNDGNYCLMYVENHNDMRLFLDKLSMGLCENCQTMIRRHRMFYRYEDKFLY